MSQNVTINFHDLVISTASNDILQLYDLQSQYIVLLETCKTDNENLIIYQFVPGAHNLTLPSKSLLINRPQHQHSYIEIMFVLSGSVTHYIEHQTFTYTVGQCCVMNKNIHHCEDVTDDFQAVFFAFQDCFLSELIQEYQNKPEDTTQPDDVNPIYQLLADNLNKNESLDKVYLDYFPLVSEKTIFSELKPIFNMIVTETISHEPGSQFFVRGAFARFFHKLNSPSLYNMRMVESNVQGQEYVFGKITHIMETSHGRAKREDLAVQLHYNGEYLNRIVKKYTGKTINEYGQSIFLKEARHMLAETDLSIAEIISRLGFSNHSHFYKLFEKTYSETPREYRMRKRNN